MNKKIKKYRYIIFIAITTIIVLPMFLLAADTNPAEGSDTNPAAGTPSFQIKIDNPFKKDTIRELIETIVNEILIPIGGVIAVLMIIYAGFLFVTARGNETQITKAKQALLWAVIGAAILLGAWVISTAIEETINELKG